MYATPETYLPTLIGLAKLDRRYAWDRALQLAADPQFAELPALLTAAMKDQAESSPPASASLSPAKRSAP